MITLGIDFAASPERTACCLIDWDQATVRLIDRPLSDDELVELIGSASVAAIDVPLGWPDAFVHAVCDHHAGRPWPHAGVDRTDLRYRLTDRRLRSQGIAPLSVSSDLIGVAAMRAARLQRMLANEGIIVDRSGLTGQLVEVYPAAALHTWGFASKGYKRGKNRHVLADLSRNFVSRCGALAPAAQAALDGCTDDDFDAFVCAVLARAARVGRTTGPTADCLEPARREGWIHLPDAPLEHVVR